MELVIIESPWRGTTLAPTYARAALHDSLMRGEAPFASHLLYTQVLDDDKAEERKLGIRAGRGWFKIADKIVFYEDHGWSGGMLTSWEVAEELGKPTEIRSIA